MTSRDHLSAAARCWERAGFFEEAAERFTTAEAWRDAGRCFSQAERHSDAALAFSRAGELLLEAREHLMASWPERAWPLYDRLRLVPFDFPSAQVEVLVGLGELEEAIRVALTSGDREAVARLAHLANTRGRPDLAAPWCSEESFAPWNRSLRWQLSPPVAETAKIWPIVEYGEVELVPIWEEEREGPTSGSRSLDWSSDGTCFAVLSGSQGLARARLSPDEVLLERWRFAADTLGVRFLPASHAILASLRGGEVSLVLEDGSIHPVENFCMPNNVWSITFAPKGDRVALAAWTNPGALLKVLSWQKEHAESQLELHRKPEGSCHPLAAWSPDGRILCWSPGLWYQSNPLFFPGQVPFEAHRDVIQSLTFTADGRFLITASWDQTVAVRDGENGQGVAPPERFANRVYGATVHPQATLIAVGEGNCLHLLRLHTDEVPRFSRLSEQSFDEDVFSLAFSPDGRHLLVMTKHHLHLFRVDLKP